MSTYEKYYVPEQSRFPIYAATSLFILVMGAASTINALGQLSQCIDGASSTHN